MVELINANFTRYGSIQISDADLETFAYNQLKDYQKDYFKEPHALDIDDFVEFYLKKSVQYYQLSAADCEKRPLGSTAITDGKVAIINEGMPEIKIFKQGTIIIDEEACESEQRRRFTLGHEAWHAQFDLHLNTELLDNANSISDTFAIIGSSLTKVKNRTPREWIGHHADAYAVYLLMPKKFVCKLFKQHHKEFFNSERRMVASRPKRTWLMINAIANDLNVSKEALAYRLRKLHLISEEVFLSLNLNKRKEEIKMI